MGSDGRKTRISRVDQGTEMYDKYTITESFNIGVITVEN